MRTDWYVQCSFERKVPTGSVRTVAWVKPRPGLVVGSVITFSNQIHYLACVQGPQPKPDTTEWTVTSMGDPCLRKILDPEFDYASSF